jgi:hypothetical protein
VRFILRLPPPLFRAAGREGRTLNQWINQAVKEKIAGADLPGEPKQNLTPIGVIPQNEAQARVMEAIRNLASMGVIPKSERQARVLTSLEPPEQKAAVMVPPVKYIQ